MTREAEDKERIVQYLLGALPEAEAERFDELSVSDGTFAEAVAAADDDLVDAYVRGELTGENADRFRSHYLASPRRRGKEQFARALQQFTERHAASRQSWRFTAVRRALSPWGLAAAVLAALFIASGWLTYQNVRLRQQVSTLQAQRRADDLQGQRSGSQSGTDESARELAQLREQRDRLGKELESVSAISLMLMPQLRSGAQPRRVAITPGTTHVAFQLVLEPGDYSRVRVDLLDAAGRSTLWSSDALEPRRTPEGRAVDVTLRSPLLQPGRYLLRVMALFPGDAAGIIGDYPFTVVRE